MVIEETATYDGVFDHNKQVHGMSDEDSETLAKGFTYSNSPPTSEESKEDNWYDEQIKKVKSQGFPMNRQMREHIKFLERERDNDGKKLNVWEQD